MSAIIAHPEFDPETMSWFWDEYEAPTLRELSALLGPQVVIADYYPRGIALAIRDIRLSREQVIWHCKREARIGKRHNGAVPKMRKIDRDPLNLRSRAAPRLTRRSHDHELILRLRSYGRTYKSIADSLDTDPSVQTVARICGDARKAGDNRALSGKQATRRALSQQRSENNAHQAS